MPAGATPRILFIGGSGRSGSTLLDRVIGQLPGFVSAGEVRDVWRAGLLENRLCGCGRPFRDCPFWSTVGEEAFGGWDEVDAAAAEAAIASFGYRDVVVPGSVSSSSGMAAERERLLSRLYAGIAAAAEGSVIVDSSKAPPYGVLLASLFPGLQAIHLVRDSRGVAYSWAKRVRRPDTPGRDVEMLRMSSAAVAARWIAHNGVMEFLAARVPAIRTRYEAFVASPRAAVRDGLRELGHSFSEADLSFLASDHVRLEPNHTVMGNPMRMAVGEVPLRADVAWELQLPLRDRAIVTALTWPMLIRYGYQLVPKGRLAVIRGTRTG